VSMDLALAVEDDNHIGDFSVVMIHLTLRSKDRDHRGTQRGAEKREEMSPTDSHR